MPSVFDDLWSDAQGVFDGPLGEGVTITPQVTKIRRSRYGSGGPDPDNPSFGAVGIFRSAVVPVRAMGAGANTRDNPDLLVDKTTIDFDVAQFTPGTTPVQGWIVTLASRPGEPAYRIEAVKPDEVARIVCVLTPETPVPPVSPP